MVQELELLAAEQSEEAAKLIQPLQIKPLHKVISEHKDVVKIVIQLNSIISTFKGDVQESLDVYTKYSELWNQVSYQTLRLIGEWGWGGCCGTSDENSVPMRNLRLF